MSHLLTLSQFSSCSLEPLVCALGDTRLLSRLRHLSHTASAFLCCLSFTRVVPWLVQGLGRPPLLLCVVPAQAHLCLRDTQAGRVGRPGPTLPPKVGQMVPSQWTSVANIHSD